MTVTNDPQEVMRIMVEHRARKQNKIQKADEQELRERFGEQAFDEKIIQLLETICLANRPRCSLRQLR